MTKDQVLKEKIITKAWEDEAFKEKLLSDPKAALKESFGIELPETLDVEAVNETTRKVYFVIPPRPTDLKDSNNIQAAMWP